MFIAEHFGLDDRFFSFVLGLGYGLKGLGPGPGFSHVNTCPSHL